MNILNDSVMIIFVLFVIDFVNIISVVVVGFVIVFIIFGNVIVCVSFYIFWDFWIICNYFIISFVIFDILVVILGMLFWLVL